MQQKKKRWISAIFICLLLTVILSGCSKKYRISVESGQELLEECPDGAKSGDKVVIKTLSVTDGTVHVSVNGMEDFGNFTQDARYEFIMPKMNVKIDAWTKSNGLTDTSEAGK